MPDHNEYSELSPKEKMQAARVRKIRIGLIVGLVVFVALAIIIPLAVYGGKRKHIDPSDAKLPFTFDTMFSSTLQPTSMSLQWGPTSYYSFVDTVSGDINKFDLTTSTTTMLLNKSELASGGSITSWDRYYVSPDSTRVLLATKSQPKWRHSFSAIYYVYDVASTTVTPLVSDTTRLLNVQWNPVSSLVAYVQANDIYILDLSTQQTTRITDDGSNVLFNGVQSWVYEEEIFSDYNAMWWSPDGSSLTYFRSNESSVHIYSFPLFTQDNPYNSYVDIPYPKPGYANPTVTIHNYNVASGANTTFDTSAWEYIATVQWANTDSVIIQLLNRPQTKVDAARLTVSTGTLTVLPYYAVKAANGWIDVTPFVIFDEFFVSLEIDEYNANMHLQLRGQVDGAPQMWLTDGAWDVTGVVGWCPISKLLYYVSAEVGGVSTPLQRQIYSVDIVQRTKTQISTVTPAWYSASMSPSGGYIVMRYGGPNVPQQFLKSTTDNEFSITLTANDAYAAARAKYALPTTQFTTVTVNGNTFNVMLQLPYNFDSNLKYPLLVKVYGGPSSQIATYSHITPFWEAYLTSQGYVCASIDGRGTGGRGLNWLWSTYKQLGVLESQDQNDAVRALAAANPYINATKMAIWGWSYGGYTTGMVMSSAAGVFRAGISVAPVTDWRFYDSTYTERYMDTPQANPQGYAVSSVLPRAGNITSDSYLLIHGTADDNVHFMQSAVLEGALIKNGVQFQTMNYINQNHGITGNNSPRHLYTLMDNFLTSHILNI